MKSSRTRKRTQARRRPLQQRQFTRFCISAEQSQVIGILMSYNHELAARIQVEVTGDVSSVGTYSTNDNVSPSSDTA